MKPKSRSPKKASEQFRLVSMTRRHADERQVLIIRSGEAVIGRQEGCKIRIPSHSVSRRHAKLLVLNDLLTIEDLGSSNGTYVNDMRITEQTYVKPGDVIRVGPFRFLADYALSDRAVEALIAYLTERQIPLNEDDIDVDLLLDDDEPKPLRSSEFEANAKPAPLLAKPVSPKGGAKTRLDPLPPPEFGRR